MTLSVSEQIMVLHDAIRLAYPNAELIKGNDLPEIEVFDASNNLISIDENLINAQLTNAQNNFIAAQTAQATAKASALAKLTALGLTEDEIKALIG